MFDSETDMIYTINLVDIDAQPVQIIQKNYK